MLLLLSDSSHRRQWCLVAGYEKIIFLRNQMPDFHLAGDIPQIYTEDILSF